MTNKIISSNDLQLFFDALLKSGKNLIAPRNKGNKVFFAPVKSYDQIAKDYIQTGLSAKSVVFPRTEELFRYVLNGKEIIMMNPEDNYPETIVFGLRPCDSAAFEYLKDFFLNENPDFHFKRRLDKTAFLNVSCNNSDDYCFCTSVGLNPGSIAGSDMTFTAMGDIFYIEAVTDKAESLLNSNPSLFKDTAPLDKEPFLAKVPVKFQLDKAITKADSEYNNPIWEMESLACLGCGACAFSCPTCTCFDIQDEVRPKGGVRLRIWDTCAQSLFTVHASGHNPRNSQSLRWKHRLRHKFLYSKENLDKISCVGCGRCSRACPAGMNIAERLSTLAET